MAAPEGKGLLALVKGSKIPASTGEREYERKQVESHWNCPFFRHCRNEGLKLPTRSNCPECSDQYWEFRQSQANRRSIHAQDAYHHNNMDRRLKMKVFMIGWEKESLDRTGLIMKRKAIKEMCGRKTGGA